MRTTPDLPNLFIVDHPLIQHKLSLLRAKDQPTDMFRRLLREIALLMGYEITRDAPLTEVTVETPIQPMQAPVLAGRGIIVAPILRAGLGMADALVELIPTALIGHIGLYRDEETRQPVEYLMRLPDPAGRQVYMVDPMLATGNSAAYAADLLLKAGVAPDRLRFLALIAVPEGVRRFHAAHPDVPVYVAALDSHLNDQGYIVPGLGDAGDRYFGT